MHHEFGRQIATNSPTRKARFDSTYCDLASPATAPSLKHTTNEGSYNITSVNFLSLRDVFFLVGPLEVLMPN